MRLIKLTDDEGYTQNKTHWQVGTTHTASGKRAKLCTNGVIHAYTSELLAVLMNPTHAQFINPQCFEAEGDIVVSDGTKVGCRSLTITGYAKLPEIAITQRISFGILCAKEVCKSPSWNIWADKWLSGENRSRKSATDAADAAAAAAAADADADAADAAAAYAAAADAADAAAYAAYAASAAASYDASAAADSNIKIDFQSLAEKALTYK
jgi:hypothetical protein